MNTNSVTVPLMKQHGNHKEKKKRGDRELRKRGNEREKMECVCVSVLGLNDLGK